MKLEMNKYYNLTELADSRLLPVNNNRETLAKLVEIDMNGANLMKVYRKEWKIKGKYTYKVKGSDYLTYINFRGYEQEM